MCIVIFYDQAGHGMHTIFLKDFSLLEGNTSSQLANFTVTLDAPATERVTFLSSLQDGSASSSSGDFDDTYAYGTATIDAGRQSAYLTVVVRGDTRLEGNEAIKLVLSGAQNAVFADNALSLLATATIIDDDQGEPTHAWRRGRFRQDNRNRGRGRRTAQDRCDIDQRERRQQWWYMGFHPCTSVQTGRN